MLHGCSFMFGLALSVLSRTRPISAAGSIDRYLALSTDLTLTMK